MSTPARRHAARLRAVAEHVGQPGVSQLARAPGVQTVYRVTVFFADRRACHVVATVVKTQIGGTHLTLLFEGALGHKPLVYPLADDRLERLIRALALADFDHLPDQPNLPEYATTDLWFIERAAGAFSHSVIVAPALAQDVYATLAATVREHLPEALREIAP
ncbi:MAG: hypothetical protein KC519_13905 [Anaerolineae bacterium]|nr:hypothetical protein [Anaerolineae bacterium]